MKTVADYLELLPQPYKTAAVLACTLEGVLESPAESLCDALTAFDWSEYAIQDADKTWPDLYSLAKLSEPKSDPELETDAILEELSEEEIIQTQHIALKDMGFDLNLN